MEMLINLGYDEIILLRSINYFFENEHHMYRDQMRDLVFDLVVQVCEKIVDGTIPLDIEDYYDGSLENEMDHANITQMRHLLRDAGAHLFKRMYNPGIAQNQDRLGVMDGVMAEERDKYARLRKSDEQFRRGADWTTGSEERSGL